MEIFPQVTRKSFGDCEPGELIRWKWGEEPCYALVAANEGHPYLVLLSATRDAGGPEIILLQRPDLSVISYGNAYRIEVDQSAEYVDLTGQRLWEKTGALLVGSDHFVMRVAASPQSGLFGTLYVRLDTGIVVEEPAGPLAIFAKWSLMLPKGGDRYETLLTIE